MTFLAETTKAIEDSGHSGNDIVFIGSEKTGHRCTWEEFRAMADFDYDSGIGISQIASDLIVVFSDGSSMWRGECNGQEWWEFTAPFVEPVVSKPIRALVSPSNRDGGMTLDELNP